MDDRDSHAIADDDMQEDHQFQSLDNSSQIQVTKNTNDDYNEQQEINKLQEICNKLTVTFPSLSIHLTASKDFVPFIHVWKPIKKGNENQGMPFLPCFHIIVTLHTLPRVGSTTNAQNHALFQLNSFHGKVRIFLNMI